MSDEKATECIMVRIGGGDMLRAKEASKKLGLTPTALARMGLFELVGRIEANHPKVNPTDAARLARLKAIEDLPGIVVDLDAELERMRDRLLLEATRAAPISFPPTGTSG